MTAEELDEWAADFLQFWVRFANVLGAKSRERKPPSTCEG